jgi:hypothetical protein
MVSITIYTSDLDRIGIIETHKDLTFARSYFGCGEFSLSINANIPNADLFEENRLIVIDNNKYKTGIITKIEKKLDKNGKGDELLQINGYELKYLLSRRIVWPNVGVSFSLSGAAETVIKTLIDFNCGLSVADTKRKLTKLSIAADQERGFDYTVDTKYTNLLDECQTAAVQGAIGWRIYPDFVAKRFIVDCFLGIDHSASQRINPIAIFSTDRETLKSASIISDYSAYRNLIYVGGSGVGTDRLIAKGFKTTEPEDMERFEGFADESNIANSTELLSKASAYIEQYSKIYTMDGAALTKSPLTLDKDYSLGDLISIHYKEASLDTQIVEVAESWAAASYEVSLTWGKDTPSISKQVGLFLKRLLLLLQQESQELIPLL